MARSSDPLSTDDVAVVVKLLRGVRHRRYPLALAGRAYLVSGAVIIPTVLASALIAATMFWALPTGAALNERHVLLLNVVTASIYSAISIPSAIVWGYLWLTIPASADEGIEGRTILAAPSRMAVIHGTVWLTATLVMVVINVKTPPLATTVGVSLLVAATVTTAMSYWMCERALRPSVAMSGASAEGSRCGGGSESTGSSARSAMASVLTPCVMAAPSSTTSRRAPESLSCRTTSPSVNLGLTGVTVAPSRQDAKSSTTNSTRLGNLTPTTSPAPIPNSHR
jgi:hypothetical protein